MIHSLVSPLTERFDYIGKLMRRVDLIITLVINNTLLDMLRKFLKFQLAEPLLRHRQLELFFYPTLAQFYQA